MDTLGTLGREFQSSYIEGSGYNLSQTLSPIAPSLNPKRLIQVYRSVNHQTPEQDIRKQIVIEKHPTVRIHKEESDAWVTVYQSYWRAIGEILKAEAANGTNMKLLWTNVFDAWKEMTLCLVRGYDKNLFEAWTVPCLYVAGKYLRIFAIKADQVNGSEASLVNNLRENDMSSILEEHEKLEEAARILNKIFQVCLADRAPLEESRKWGIYYIINLLFKTYFKLNSITLSKNITRALQAYRGDMPTLDAFPMAHQITFKYYAGVISFLEEAYEEAEKNLTEAWHLCLKSSTRNKELILTYLIPCRLLTTHTLPTITLLRSYPRLQNMFLPLTRCIKRGDLSGFDKALVSGENEFTKLRIYLTLERGRDIALRNLLRKVFIAGGFEDVKDPSLPPARRTRIPVSEFGAAISLGSRESLDNDEIECLIANLIYKNLMKGYISRERGIVVLSRSGAFPGTGV
ncbi:Protein CSN12-like protein [Golovinomyces cichoracearum]|uniref:Protein CSN12 homolog n=1 Tax=Golovinomyces cichoracearum TaxID=62708 RepID=A0A420ISQ5_9PEZI|nr:Protein CSN12-like protein [Golovinomyces cichoracearum]